jgi:hypothetical protein
MRNFGLPKAQQKFHRDTLPEKWKRWKNGSEEKDDFVKQMFHIRDNGEWWLINGNPIYITGIAWCFFNFWTLQKGNLPDFRYEAVEFFLVENWIWRSPHIMGLVIIKRRQEGATAKINASIYFRTTRREFFHAGIIGDDEKRAKANIEKIGIAHRKMADFFKPKTKGSDKSDKLIEFSLPHVTASKKMYKDGKDEIEDAEDTEGLGSWIDIESSTSSAYDGDRPDLLYCDEVFKIWRFDPNALREKWQQCLESVNKDGTFTGKCYLASTVEDDDKDESKIAKIMPNATKMWRLADPNLIDDYGRTKNFLVRYFRDSFSTTGLIDEFGFPKIEQAKKLYDTDIKKYTDAQDWFGLSGFKRRNPLKLEDALSLPTKGCVLFPHNLDRKITCIEMGLDLRDRPKICPAVRGNLEWVGSKMNEVIWVADPANGKWLISEHPSVPNKKRLKNGKAAPANTDIYKMGVDPTDAFEAVSSEEALSKTGICVKRVFDRKAEPAFVEFFLQDGVEVVRNPEDMTTDRVVCTYLHRHDDPIDTYSDTLKTAIYFGTAALIETNSGYVHATMMREKRNYCANQPEETKSTTQKRFGKKGVEPQKGQRTTLFAKTVYNGATVSYFASRWQSIEHVDLLMNAKTFNGSNHTDCDLIVAFALAEVQCLDGKLLQSETKQEDVNDWGVNIFRGIRQAA